MYPNGQIPQQQPQPQHDPYAFITQTPNSPKRSMLNPSSMKARILFVAVFVIVLGIGAVITLSFIGKPDKTRTNNYIAIAQRQAEIIRVSSLAESKAKKLETKSKAVTIQLSITSSQSEMMTVIEKRGVSDKELTKQLGGLRNSKTDEILKEAEKNNRYDEAILEILESEIGNYQKELNQVSSGAKKSEFKVLESAFNQIAVIENQKTD